jgi:redox-sensitive bicupin YhaK (pirin superfamily)
MRGMTDPTRRALLTGIGATLAAGVGAFAATGSFSKPLYKPKNPRSVAQVLAAQPTKDGAGVRLNRALGSQALRNLDPFLLLDEFKSDDPNDYIAGFPKHPHRGFETVTIMLKGRMEHQDSMGNRGLLSPGSIQWMTAGRGIVHSEMPQQQDGVMYGFQLWVNLPARLKMTKPRYQDLPPSAVPEVDLGDARARVLAGVFGGVEGPVSEVYTSPVVFDLTLEERGELHHELAGDHTAFAYVTEGEAFFGPEKTPVPAGHLAVLSKGETVQATGKSRFLLVAGAPIGEPIARRGPFVMNTEEELDQAYADYRSGRLTEG